VCVVEILSRGPALLVPPGPDMRAAPASAGGCNAQCFLRVTRQMSLLGGTSAAPQYDPRLRFLLSCTQARQAAHDGTRAGRQGEGRGGPWGLKWGNYNRNSRKGYNYLHPLAVLASLAWTRAVAKISVNFSSFMHLGVKLWHEEATGTGRTGRAALALALGALGVQLAASFAGCVTLRSDTGTRLGRIGLPAGSQARSP
jgi:hypothetical protein